MGEQLETVHLLQKKEKPFGQKIKGCMTHRWTSIGVVFAINFLEVIQMSLYWSSLWPFLSTIDPSATESFFGFILMAFSLASALSSPIFGYFSNKLHQTRLPIIVGLLINMTGNAMLFFVEAFPIAPTNRKWMLLGARAVTGFGTGNYGALFAYIAMASTLDERNFVISVRAAVNSVGLLIGPGLQIAFVPIGYPGLVIGPFHFDMYTTPAFVNVLLGVIEVIILCTLFKEDWVAVKEGKTDPETNQLIEIKPYDKVAVWVNILVRMSVLFCFSFDTTIGSPFTITMFRWTSEQAITYNGTIQLCTGIVHLILNLVVGNLVLKYLRERTLMVIGLISMSLYYVIAFSWPGEPSLLELPNDNITCHYEWCSYTTRIYFWQYILAYIFMIPAFSVAYVPNATLFTKILGPRKQGTLQGIFASGGQFANALSPVVCSALFQYYGPRVTWSTGMCVTWVTAAVVVLAYKRLIPFDEDVKDELEKARVRKYTLQSHQSVIEDNAD